MKPFKTALLAVLLGTCVATSASAADTIKVWMRYGKNEEPVINALTKKFTEETGIKVDTFTANIDFETRLARAAVGGDLPDVIMNDGATMGQLRDMGVIQEIDKDSLKGSDKIYDVAWDSMKTFDGKYYGVPYSAQAFALFIRKDWREKLGLPVPKTWDDLYNMAKAFTEKDPDGDGKADTYGYVMPLSTTRGYATWFLSDLIWQAGGKFMDQSDKGFKSTLNTPEVAKAITFARKLVCDGYAQPSAITSVTGDATPVFSSGQAGMYRTGPYHMAAFVDEPGMDKVEIVPPPAGPAGTAELAEGTSAFITSTSKHTEDAKKFIEFLISDEGQEIGTAAALGTQPIVRLPVNKDVDAVSVYKDKNWGTFAKLYATNAHYFPRVPNWMPIRQVTSEGFNRIISDCNSDVPAGLAQMDKDVDQELSQQGVLVQ